MPPDFSIIACVQMIPAGKTMPVEAHTFVVEPDGTLRAATGAGCTLRTYPEPTASLDPREMQELYGLARKIDFNHKLTPPSPYQPHFWIRIVINADGQRWRVDFAKTIYGDDLSNPEDSLMYRADKLMAELFMHSYFPVLKGIKIDPRRRRRSGGPEGDEVQ